MAERYFIMGRAPCGEYHVGTLRVADKQEAVSILAQGTAKGVYPIGCTLLYAGQCMSAAARAADTEQSDREYIAQKQRRR